MTQPTYPRGSVEYVKATVSADVTLDDPTTVELSLSTGNSGSGYTHTWLPGEWTGDASTRRTARTVDPVEFDEVTYPERTYTLFVRLTDSPEVPLMNAGTVRVST